MKTKSRHVPSCLLDVVDANLVDELADPDCPNRLVADAERSSQFVEDGMNSTEASEERHVVAEAAAMRQGWVMKILPCPEGNNVVH